MKGLTQYVTRTGIRVLKVYYYADPDKDPQTTAGRKWRANESLGHPGGVDGDSWRQEMEIDFNSRYFVPRGARR